MKLRITEGNRTKLVRGLFAGLLLASLILTINPGIAAPQSLQARVISWAGTVRPISIQGDIVYPPILLRYGGDVDTQAPLVIYGEFLIDNETGFHGPAQDVQAEVVIGPDGTPPSAWTISFPAPYLRRAAQYGINDMRMGQYFAQIPLNGTYRYAMRFSVDGGPWVYAGRINPINPENAAEPTLGYLLASPRNDSVTPTAPTKPQILYVKPEEIRIRWGSASNNGGSAIYGYHIYRSTKPDESDAQLVGQVIGSTEFLDVFLQDGSTYYYSVRSFNQDYTYSLPSETSDPVLTPELPKFFLPLVNR